jgi:2',3'-cyclic-nucleotide 2'-phosphodiesterase/3'-nucleotidase
VESKAPAPAAEHKAPATAVKRESSTGPGSYTVAKGDNPSTIAKKLGVGYKALLDANKITDPTKLQIGQVLKVPAKSH